MKPPPLEKTAEGVAPVIPRAEGTMALAVAGLMGEQTTAPPPANSAVAAASKPKAGVDLAEIDRYLEGLGKL